MAGGRGSSKTTAEIPDELKPLISNTATQLIDLQGAAPVTPFARSRPQYIAPMTGDEQRLLRSVIGQGLFQGLSPEEYQAQYLANQGMYQARDDSGTLGALRGLAGTDLADPLSDRRAFSAMEGAGSVLEGARNIGFFGPERLERQGINEIGSLLDLNRTDLPDLSAPEQMALGQFTDLAALNQQQAGGLTAPEAGALGDLSNLGDLNLRSRTGSVTSPELQAMDLLSQTQRLGQTQLPTINAPELQSMGVLSDFTGGEFGQSPATQAAMQLFREQVQPQLQSQLALRGLERSGAAAEALAQAETAAYMPLVQQELQHRMQAVPLLQQLGQTVGGRERQDLSRQLATGTQVAGQLSGIGSELSRRGMEDLQRRLQTGVQVAGLESDIGSNLAGREMADLQRQLQSGLQIGQATQDVGADISERLRGDLARELGMGSQLAGQLTDLGGDIALRDMQAQNQLFGQQLGLANQYQGFSQMQADRDRADLDRQIQTLQSVAGLEAANRAAESDAAFRAAELNRVLGSDAASRNFGELQTALGMAGLPREIHDRQSQALYDDFLRQQSLAEQALLAPISGGVLTSGIGQRVSQKQSGLIPGVSK